jgi:TetR/AcrR family transcriptional regulator, transcriptional repressor for nem operon
MRRSRQEKAETHDAVLKRASRLFRERGIETTSVSDVMAEAGLTHGGFYRHFANKDALVAEALRETFDSILSQLETRSREAGAKTAVGDYLRYYVTKEHVTHPAEGCPIPTLAGEIGRSSDALKSEFSEQARRLIAAIAEGFDGTDQDAREQAIRALAMRVGAVLIARACDADLAKDVLASCR